MEFITVSEAVHLTGKSISTVRRLAKRLEVQGHHDQVRREQGPQGERYLIRRDILLQELGMNRQEPQSPEPHETHNDAHEQLVTHLREQVQKKDEQIGQLIERLRETNILMNNYQQRLLSVVPAEVEQQPTPPSTPQREAAKQSLTWVWLLIGILLLLIIMLTVAVRDGLITLPWVR